MTQSLQWARLGHCFGARGTGMTQARKNTGMTRFEDIKELITKVNVHFIHSNVHFIHSLSHN